MDVTSHFRDGFVKGVRVQNLTSGRIGVITRRTPESSYVKVVVERRRIPKGAVSKFGLARWSVFNIKALSG